MRIGIFGAALVASLVGVPANAQEQTVGLFLSDERAAEGYTLFSPNHSGTTYLINNDGLVVNTWTSPYRPGHMGYLLENGHLLRAARIDTAHANFASADYRSGRIEEYDWDGTLVWEFEYSSGEYLSHHDIEPMPNGNVLVIAWEYKTRQEAIDAGRNPNRVGDSLWPDKVVEIRPTPPVGGEVVWEWKIWDHLVQDYDPTKAGYGMIADHPELVNVNFGNPANADWNHTVSVDYNAERDQIMIAIRPFSELWIIDHSTTTEEAAGHTGGNSGKGGDLLYRWGNPRAYRRGTRDDQVVWAMHDAAWVPQGRPRAGNILFFNNGQSRPPVIASSVDEITPPIDEEGNYVLVPDEAYGPSALTWTYMADPPESFFVSDMGGAQRQVNGNTLICDAYGGRFFEVTDSLEMVWEYLSPVSDAGIHTQGVPKGDESFNVFKVRRYPPDYPGLAGRDLTPGDPIENFDAPLPVPRGSLQASELSPAGDGIEVRWDALACTAFDYNLLYGDLFAVASQDLLGAECGLGISGVYQWLDVPSGSLYFLLVGQDETGVYESSRGQDSAGAERSGTRSSFRCGSTTKVVSAECP